MENFFINRQTSQIFWGAVFEVTLDVLLLFINKLKSYVWECHRLTDSVMHALGCYFRSVLMGSLNMIFQ